MRIINLDQFKTVQHVTLAGIQYEVYARSVEDFIGFDIEAEINNASDTIGKINVIVDFLVKFTNIPRAALIAQDISVLNALIRLINGADVEAEAKAEAKALAEIDQAASGANDAEGN